MVPKSDHALSNPAGHQTTRSTVIGLHELSVAHPVSQPAVVWLASEPRLTPPQHPLGATTSSTLWHGARSPWRPAPIVVLEFRPRATRTTSSRTAVGYGFGTVTSFQPVSRRDGSGVTYPYSRHLR
jgi:hypothetical protein